MTLTKRESTRKQSLGTCYVNLGELVAVKEQLFFPYFVCLRSSRNPNKYTTLCKA